MEPWSSFATILGLISAYKAEGYARDGSDYNDLVQWLGEKRHHTLIEELNSNHLLSLQIKQLLQQNHESVLNNLSQLDSMLMQLASQIDGFKGLVSAINPHNELSGQSINILSQFERSGARSFLEATPGETYMYLDIHGALEVPEPRFIEDDLRNLCNIGLLLLDYNSKGQRIFKLTRLAISYLSSLKV